MVGWTHDSMLGLHRQLMPSSQDSGLCFILNALDPDSLRELRNPLLDGSEHGRYGYVVHGESLGLWRRQVRVKPGSGLYQLWSPDECLLAGKPQDKKHSPATAGHCKSLALWVFTPLGQRDEVSHPCSVSSFWFLSPPVSPILSLAGGFSTQKAKSSHGLNKYGAG